MTILECRLLQTVPPWMRGVHIGIGEIPFRGLAGSLPHRGCSSVEIAAMRKLAKRGLRFKFINCGTCYGCARTAESESVLSSIKNDSVQSAIRQLAKYGITAFFR